MAESHPLIEPQEDFQKRLPWLMWSRIIVASFFLGIAVIVQLQRSGSYLAPYLISLYSLIAAVYFLTVIYAFLNSIIKNFKWFTYAQVMVDIMLITMLIFITGGINSIFSFMYSISIISASILLYRYGGILTATTASFCYSSLLSLQYYQIISPLQMYPFIATGYAGEVLFYPIVVNITAFYLVALLSSFISEQARKSRLQLQEKQIDIKKLEALNENIIQSIKSGLLTLDPQGSIITLNRAASEITGLAHEDVYLRHINEIFPEIQPSQLTEWSGVDDNPLTSRFEIAFSRQDGKELQLGFSFSRLEDTDGNEIGKILVFQDLTRFKEMEDYIKRMDRLAAVGRLAAGIAHEVRNPLASISGSIQVLGKSLQLSDKDKRLMDIALRESNNLNQLIANFIQFARPDSNRREWILLKNAVDEIIQLFKNSPECKPDLIITQDIDENIYLEADPQQFKQVLWNLVINAAQAIHTEGGEISIMARYKEPGFYPPASVTLPIEHLPPSSRWIEFVVQDSGCGIDDKDKDKIFEPFFTTKDHGIGLGLSIVYRIIEELGGTIAVQSKKGIGTNITILIPQQPAKSIDA